MGRDARFNLHHRQIIGAGGLEIDPHNVVMDRFGRQIGMGDLILHNPVNPVAATIVHLQPALDPGVPPGMMRMIFTAQYNVLVPKGQPLGDIVLVNPATDEQIAAIRRAQANGARTEGIVIPGSPDAPAMTDDPESAPPAPGEEGEPRGPKVS